MKSLRLLIAITLQLSSFSALTSAKTEPLAATTVPFQLISPAEFKAILELNSGNPFITQNRLLNSGSQAVTDILNNIVNGLISPVNITGLNPIYNSVFKPINGNAQGYPFCAIQTHRNNQHSQRSYDTIVDPVMSNFGTFSINFYQPGTVNIDNYDEDTSIDEMEPEYQSQRPMQPETSVPSITISASANHYTNSPSANGNKDKPDNFVAPIINCIVVLKEPSQPATRPPSPTASYGPASSQRPFNRPSARPSFYPQYPTILTPHQPPPRDPNYSIGSYQIVPIPYPPFLGLLGPASGTSNWPNWSGSQAIASQNPNSAAISPTWPYWSLASPSIASHQSIKNPQTVPTASWPYLAIPSSSSSSLLQSTNTHVPTTSPYLPSSFWAAINNPSDAGNAAPSPTISIHSNPAAWLRPPAGAFNPSHLLQQQQLQQQQQQQQQLQLQQNYNENTDEIRSALHDESASGNKENQQQSLIGDENDVGDAVERSQKQQSQRVGVKSKNLPR